MAAYGALVSLVQIIVQIQSHPQPPISLDQKQIESLTQLITFLQNFLEGYSSHSGDFLESSIAEVANDAEDVIESYIVDQIRIRSRNDAENITSTEFCQGLQKVIDKMYLVKIGIKEMMEGQEKLHIIKPRRTDVASSFKSTSVAQNVTMIGFDDVLLQMLEWVG